MSKKKFDIKSLENVKHFDVDFNQGLTNEQVQSRINEGLINKTKKLVSKSYFRIVYDNFVNFFNVILFLIAGFMIAAGIELKNFVFLVILIANISIGLYQDIRARKLIDKLKFISDPKATVIRNGKKETIDGTTVVVSDIVEVKAGTQIICDGTIVDGFVEINESMLTGEPRNVVKKTGDPIFSGSFITSGTAKYRVDKVGRANYAEKLTAKAQCFKKTKSEILKNIKRILRTTGFLVVIIGVAEILLLYKTDANFKEKVATVSSSLIAMIPIGMYLLTSITLAVGTIRLAKKNMLTQDMYCIEMLARVDTLCLDKTGTLTDGQLTIDKVVATSNSTEKEIAKVVLTLVDQTNDTNGTANAIREAFGHMNKYDAHGFIPFKSDRKYSAVMLDDGRTIIMGAREFIPHTIPEIDEECKKYESQGLRLVMVCMTRQVVDPTKPLGLCETLGFIVSRDHIRNDAEENIQWFKDNGVDVKIITGDNPYSAGEIARRAGIDGYEKQVSLSGLSLEEVRNLPDDYVIYGRVTPEQKEALVEGLQRKGRTVAMTGDGVNDILALRVADCSIAMASGTDAAKNVAHLVALDSNFSALPDVVREGRRVINNLQRAISIFLIKTVFAILLTSIFMVLSITTNGLVQSYPFNPPSLYIWEIVNIGIGSMFLSLQPNDEKVKSSFLVNILSKVIPAALVQVLIVIFFYSLFILGKFDGGVEIARNTAKTLSVITFSVFSFIILIRVCIPFDVYRTLLVVGLGFLQGILLLADYFLNHFTQRSLLEIDYGCLSKITSISLVIGALLVSVILYIFFEFLAIKLHNYLDKREAVK